MKNESIQNQLSSVAAVGLSLLTGVILVAPSVLGNHSDDQDTSNHPDDASQAGKNGSRSGSEVSGNPE